MEASELRSVSSMDLTARMVSEHALRGDRLALEAYERCGGILGKRDPHC